MKTYLIIVQEGEYIWETKWKVPNKQDPEKTIKADFIKFNEHNRRWYKLIRIKRRRKNGQRLYCQ